MALVITGKNLTIEDIVRVARKGEKVELHPDAKTRILKCREMLEKKIVAHEIMYGGMEYAERYGFEPNPDFTALKTDMMLDAPDAHPRVNNVVFGNDGQPFYISGPFDDNRKIKHINDTLTRTAGEGNFKFIVNLGGMGADDDF